MSHRRYQTVFYVPVQVGARVKGKVLTVDASSSKATLTLKRSMLKDKRPAITTFEEVRLGRVTLANLV